MLQWLLVATVVVGLGWLGLSFLLAYLQLPPLPEGDLVGVACPDGVSCRRRARRFVAGRTGQDRRRSRCAAAYDEGSAIAACRDWAGEPVNWWLLLSRPSRIGMKVHG